ncbi:MAG: HNH endonuclease, partial [Flavobacteriales bacterium]|nr:HNH endonuclease [Flavobacteriales bacterium]
HSNGYAVFQRCITTKKGPVYETIYLHKYIAEKFVKKPDSGGKKLFVRFIDGDVLNAQIENLQWVTMNTLRRQMKNFKSKTGYRGVTKEKNRYRAVIYHERKAFNLGFYDTAEKAAVAYNKKSRELFGETGSLNEIN